LDFNKLVIVAPDGGYAGGVFLCRVKPDKEEGLLFPQWSSQRESGLSVGVPWVGFTGKWMGSGNMPASEQSKQIALNPGSTLP
jgi:hypothetical protein